MKDPELGFDLKELLAAIDEMKTDFAIYGGENSVLYVNKSAEAHWPVLYEQLRKGVHRRLATRAQIKSQYPTIPDDKLDEIADRTYDATVAGDLIDISTADHRIVQTVHQTIGDRATLAMSIDVTDLRARERELLSAKRAAERANEAKSEFLAKMSHEIRTPMNGVLGIAALLRDTDLDETQTHYVETIHQSGQALIAVINEILDFSKIEAERVELASELFSPLAVTTDVVALLKPIAATKRISLLLDAEVAPDFFMRGDAGRVRQVLMNIVGNALKFTEAGGVTISLSERAAIEGAKGVQIKVRDTGIGIPEADQEKVFEMFAQSSATTSMGTGLGLSIARSLIELMGGALTLSSKVGVGSCFTVELPTARIGPKD